MSNEDGTVWLVFNGEIYNYEELRAELVGLGHVFKSKTDSEVIVHLWEEHGRAMLARLNGMFALCIWDERRGEAFLGRDHAGMKPLYVAETDTGFLFASEAKVLLGDHTVNRTVDPISLQQFLTFLWVPGERTMWSGIRKIAAGGWLAWTERGIETGVWWDWDQSQQETRTPDEWVQEVRSTLVAAVGRHLRSDVPLGILLSGGLDSSAIAAAMRKLNPGEPIRAYTTRLRGDLQDGFVNDLPYARAVADRLGIDLTESDIEPEIGSLLPLLIWHGDEPMADPALAASYLLCRRARLDGTVVLLSGQGADELYHGYRSHRAMHMAGALSAIPGPMARAASSAIRSLAGHAGVAAGAWPRRAAKVLDFAGASRHERILRLADWASHSIRTEILLQNASSTDETVYTEYLELYHRSRAQTDEERWSYVLFKTFLPALNLSYGDRTSMATSVELRVPFMDRALVEQAGRMPLSVKRRMGRQKWVLGEAVRPWLPAQVVSRPKTGFGVPLRKWLAHDLRGQVRNILLGERLLSRGFFRREGIERLLLDLESGKSDVSYLVWAILTFEIWARTFIDADGAAPIERVV